MTAFLFLQKFDDGVPAAMPYAPLMARLSSIGALGQGRGDLEVALPADAMAATCTVIGNAEEGIACIGFERPRFDAALRELVWDCMTQFGCAVFDDTLNTVYTTPQGRADLPDSLLRACTQGARRISSALQLWPGEFEIGIQGPARPALLYTNANSSGSNYQLFDYAGPNGTELVVEVGMRPQACNPGTLRVLRNLALRIDAAISINPSYAIVYRYEDQETSLRMLESAPLGELAKRATIVSAAPGEADGFVADRGIFASEDAQVPQFTRYVRQKYGIGCDPGMPGIVTLAGLLDQAHAAFLGAALPAAGMTAWAKMAGAYLGHFIVQQVGAQWGYVSRAQQRMLVVRTHGGRIFCPHHLVLDHIVNGVADNIVPIISALMRDEASDTPRGEDLVCQIPVLCEQLRGVRQFDGGARLPFAQLLARGKLNFSLASLHSLDQYLAQLALRLGELSDQALTDAILCAGAYLGETIRSNAAGDGHWQWLSYEHAARRDPDFARTRPREIALLAILDSAEQMAYPFAHVAAILDGSATGTAHAYARRLGVTGPAGEPAPIRQEQEGASGDPVLSAAESAAWRAQLRQEERRLDGAGVLVAMVPQVLALLLLGYATTSSLSDFAPLAASVGALKSLAYRVWIVFPSLYLAGCIVKAKREVLLQCSMLAASIMLVFFCVGVYSVHLVPKADPDNIGVFLWVPLAQFAWSFAWIRLMRHYVDND